MRDSSRISSEGSRARGRISTMCGSRPAAATCARSGRRASSGWRSSRSSSPRRMSLQSRSAGAPLVLLDDVLSELDGDRRRALAELVANGGQTVVTATAAAALPGEPAQSLAVSPGRIR